MPKAVAPMVVLLILISLLLISTTSVPALVISFKQDATEDANTFSLSNNSTLFTVLIFWVEENLSLFILFLLLIKMVALFCFSSPQK